MGIPSLKNRIGMTVSGTPGTGTITLSTALTGYQSFPTAYAANATVDIPIEDGDAREIARDREQAAQLQADLERGAKMLESVLAMRETQELLRIAKRREDEELILMLMAA